jgi:hypothetical protein
VKKNMRTEKTRRVYKRQEVLHTCFDGLLIGPSDANESEITEENLVSVKPLEAKGGLLFEVTCRQGKGRKVIVEQWTPVALKGDSRCS